jgi:hypothetical protein
LNHLQSHRDEAEGVIEELEPPVDCHVLPNEEEANQSKQNHMSLMWVNKEKEGS